MCVFGLPLSPCCVTCVHPSLCVGIIFISYALQVHYRPFVDPNLDTASDLRTSVTYVRAA